MGLGLCSRHTYIRCLSLWYVYTQMVYPLQVYFRQPEVNIPQTIKDEILLSSNLASPQEKVSGRIRKGLWIMGERCPQHPSPVPFFQVRSFLHEFEEISRKLKFQEKLQKHFVTRLIAEGTGKYWKYLNLILTYAVNVSMLAAYDASTDPNTIEPQVP